MKTPKTVRIEAPVRLWDLVEDNTREYVTAEMTYGDAAAVIKADRFNAATGRGEQRQVVDSHAAFLADEMLSGNFTPTPVAAHMRASHRKAAVIADGVLTLDVSSDDPLASTNGNHRFEALGRIHRQAVAAGDEALAARVLRLPVTVTVYMDGSSQRDFVTLQAGKKIDGSHLFAIKVRQGMFDGPNKDHVKLAVDIARELDKREGSPYQKQIRFDSKGLQPLQVKSLCDMGAGGLGTSLVGLAKVGALSGRRPKPDALADLVVRAVNAVRDRAPELLAQDMPLTPPPDGTVGSATMGVGLGVVLAYRLAAAGADAPTDADLDALAAAAREACGRPVAGKFSAADKRELMGKLAEACLADLQEPAHQGVPVRLLTTLSCSTFAVGRLPAALRRQAEESEA
jgi:hypothetical protein